MKARQITPEERDEICRVISYDPDTGFFYHRVDRGRSKRFKAGSKIEKVPNKKHGYITFEINGRSYLAHRIAWLLMTGEWPETIDHIDHDILNNKFSNLRAVSQLENMKNVSLYKSNTSGVPGICHSGRNKDMWRVTVGIDGAQKYVGEYRSFDEAVEARRTAMIEQGYHPNHGQPALGDARV